MFVYSLSDLTNFGQYKKIQKKKEQKTEIKEV